MMMTLRLAASAAAVAALTLAAAGVTPNLPHDSAPERTAGPPLPPSMDPTEAAATARASLPPHVGRHAGDLSKGNDA